MLLRSVHTTIVNDMGWPSWISYVIFAVSTIVMGALLGLVSVKSMGTLSFILQLHSFPLIWSSDIWSFRIFHQFLGGPNFPEYTNIDHISRILPEFRLFGQFLGGPNVDHISGTECIWL